VRSSVLYKLGTDLGKATDYPPDRHRMGEVGARAIVRGAVASNGDVEDEPRAPTER